MTSTTDNRTTELRVKLNKLVIELDRLDIMLDSPASNMTLGEYEQEREKLLDGFMQAIAATLGRPKAKAHPYGYEPDTGAFDCTRCECGCINDISATYCNDCGGEIEIDMYAEKEIYHTPRHLVFAEKHDDGSLEFGGKRYVAATLGSETCEDVGRYCFTCSKCGWTANEPHHAFGGFWPKFCPNCGCKVIGG